MLQKQTILLEVIMSNGDLVVLVTYVFLFQGNGRSVGRLAVTINFFKLSPHLVNGLLDVGYFVKRKLFCHG